MTKNELRRYHLNLRKQMSSSDVLDKSSQIVKVLLSQKWIEDADIIFSYQAFNNEVSLAELNNTSRVIALPQVIDAKRMVFRIVTDTTQFLKSSYGVLEPIDGLVVEPTKESVILMPGSCFDLTGNRIGYGGGYYDCYLNSSTYKGKRVGICFDNQITESIPVEAHDVIVDAIITESQFIEFNHC